MRFNRVDICEAYAVLEFDYNRDGCLHERPSNVRRGLARGYVAESTGVQLARMGVGLRPDLAFNTLTENARRIYRAAERRVALA